VACAFIEPMTRPELRSLGANVRRFRLRRNISQLALAKTCRLQRPYISDLENGHRNPSFGSLLRVALGLKMTISELTENIVIERLPRVKPRKPVRRFRRVRGFQRIRGLHRRRGLRGALNGSFA
jgi:transcriptional regulator with XRE-family HTH domain